MNYEYYMPTRIISGEDCIIGNPEAFGSNGQTALIVTGQRSAKANGALADVESALEKQNIEYYIYDKVMSNPTVECAYEGAEIAKKVGANFVVVIGGGSPMDAGKAIALLAVQDIDEMSLFAGRYEDRSLPVVAVPTTAGTGSEVTQYAVLTDNQDKTKKGIGCQSLFPRVSFLDAKYMKNLSAEITVNTAIDVLSHAMEGMLSVRASTISDSLARESISKVMNYADQLTEAKKSRSIQGIDLDMRNELLQASCLAGMVIAQTGTIAVHALGYSLTYFKGIDHGRANGLVFSEYLEIVQEKNIELASKILIATGFDSVHQFKLFMDKLLGEKETLDFNEISTFAKKAVITKNIPNSQVPIDEQEIIKIYSNAFQ